MRKFYYILFVFLPLIGLFILGLFLDTDQTQSVSERRTSATQPQNIFEDTAALENYISDHLPFREHLLAIYFNLGLFFNFGTEKILRRFCFFHL